MNRIAVHRICGIGDAVQLTPLLRQIRADFPQARVTCFISENAAGVLRGAAWIDELVSLSTESVTPASSNPALWRMWQTIAAHGRHDLFLHLGARWLHSLGAGLVRAGRRAGLSTSVSWRPHPFDAVVPLPTEPRNDTIHASQRYLDLWTAATGMPDRGLGCSLEHLGHANLAPFFGITAPYLCFAPGAGNWLHAGDNKRWPASHWQQLITLAQADGFAVCVLGTAGDFPQEKLPPGVVSLTGRTTLDETASIIRHSVGFVGHDSGLFHMALGLGVPAAAFFGPTREDLTGPFRQPRSLILRTDIPCARCCRSVCVLPDATARAVEGSPPCMHEITPVNAWSRLRAFFQS